MAAPAPKTLVLKAIHVPWKQATKGISVKLDHSAADQYHRELVRRSQVLKKRDIRNNTDIVTLKSNIPERVKLYPLPLLSRQNRQVTGYVLPSPIIPGL